MGVRVGMRLLARNWKLIALRGLAAIVFGLVTFVMPAATLDALVLLFGSYAIVDGLFNVIAALRGRGGERRWWVLGLEGLISIAAGVATFAWPAPTALILVYVIATWAVITGFLELVAAVRLRRVIANEWWLGLAGVLSIALGTLLFMAPAAGALTLVLWVGSYAVVFGAVLIGLALRLRRWREDTRIPLQKAA